MMPGITPAINSFPADSRTKALYTIIGTLGGMRIPKAPPATQIPTAKKNCNRTSTSY